MAEEKKEPEEKITQWKPGYRAGVTGFKELEEVDTRHPMEKAYRKGKL